MAYDDIIGYVGDGCFLCDTCGAKYPDDDVSPVFDDGGDNVRAGETCGDCGAFYTPSEEWSAPHDTPDYQADLKRCRWATCAKCNHQEPRWRNDERARRDALRGEMICSNCHGHMHF